MTTRPATPPSLSIERTPSWSPHRMFLKGYGAGTIYHIQERKTGAARGATPEWLGFDSHDKALMAEIERRYNSYPRLVEALKLARIELIREGHDPLSACISKDIDPLLRSLGEIE
jgi:hypothetical protein